MKVRFIQCLALVLAAVGYHSVARASTPVNFALEIPAITCSGDPGLVRSSSSLINGTFGSLWMECPVPINANSGDFDVWNNFSNGAGVNINVSPYTSCWEVKGDAAGNAWSVGPNSVRHYSNFDEVDFSSIRFGFTGGWNLQVQCLLLTNQRANQYAIATHWQDWFQ